MLVLSRKVGETIDIDGNIKIRVVKINGNRVRIGIEAPDAVHVVRSELGEWSEQSFDRPIKQLGQESKGALQLDDQ